MGNSRGYPLGALFVLVTTCAVLAAGITPLVRLDIDGDEEIGRSLIAAGIGAVCGMILGQIIGLLQFRKIVGMAMGGLAGMLIGAAAGIISLLPVNQVGAAAAAMTAGSALIVGVALIMRRGEG